MAPDAPVIPTTRRSVIARGEWSDDAERPIPEGQRGGPARDLELFDPGDEQVVRTKINAVHEDAFHRNQRAVDQRLTELTDVMGDPGKALAGAGEPAGDIRLVRGENARREPTAGGDGRSGAATSFQGRGEVGGARIFHPGRGCAAVAMLAV